MCEYWIVSILGYPVGIFKSTDRVFSDNSASTMKNEVKFKYNRYSNGMKSEYKSPVSVIIEHTDYNDMMTKIENTAKSRLGISGTITVKNSDGESVLPNHYYTTTNEKYYLIATIDNEEQNPVGCEFGMVNPHELMAILESMHARLLRLEKNTPVC